MTRILITADTVGGVWQYATDLARALKGDEFDPVLVTLGPRPTGAQRADAAGIERIETDLSLDWLASSAAEVADVGRQIARLAAMEGADLVQLNSPALAGAAEFDQPVVAVAHSCVGTWWQAVRTGPIDPDLGWRAELTREGLLAADRIVTPSAAFAAALQRCYGLPEAPEIVHNGRKVRAVPSGAPHDFAFTAGRLWDEAKNLAALDRAAAQLAVPLRAAGPVRGPNGVAIELQHVAALGTLTDEAVAGWLAARPVFVSSAVYEPFGLAVLEAAQAGCPLVLSDIPTFREVWDGAARFVYAHDDAGFARAIEEILGDDALRARLGAAARERSARYTPEATAAGMRALYRDLLAVEEPELAAA